MSYISDKIAEVRALGHSIPEGVEELFLAIEEKIGLEAPKKDAPKQLAPPKSDPGDELNR